MREPVVPLLVNLYGHPLAGLLWEKFLERQLIKLGWTKLKSCECLFKRKEARLLLPVYVGDLKWLEWQGNQASKLDFRLFV